MTKSHIVIIGIIALLNLPLAYVIGRLIFFENWEEMSGSFRIFFAELMTPERYSYMFARYFSFEEREASLKVTMFVIVFIAVIWLERKLLHGLFL
jgi:hypothetical protein